jgi:hypothetical protein
MKTTGVVSTTDVKVFTRVKKISSVQDLQNLYSAQFVEDQKARLADQEPEVRPGHQMK